MWRMIKPACLPLLTRSWNEIKDVHHLALLYCSDYVPEHWFRLRLVFRGLLNILPPFWSRLVLGLLSGRGSSVGSKAKSLVEKSKIKVSLQGGSLQREHAPWERTGKGRGRKPLALAGDAGGSSGWLNAYLDIKPWLGELPTHFQLPRLPSDSMRHCAATNLYRSAYTLTLPEPLCTSSCHVEKTVCLELRNIHLALCGSQTWRHSLQVNLRSG